MDLDLVRTTSRNEDFLQLAGTLDQELASLYGAKQSFFDRFNKPQNIGHVIVAYENSIPIGCGAFKDFDGSAEIKRMFVLKDKRGHGVATTILQGLERWAAESGYKASILETGYKQPEAIALYKRCGYTVIPNFGQYAHVEESVCMSKNLSPR